MDSSSFIDTFLECSDKNVKWRNKKKTVLGWNEYNLSVVRDYVVKFEPECRALSSFELVTRNLEKFFLVPKQFDAFKENELVATFINFLLQLLYGTSYFEILYEELRFLLMVLGDAPFLYYDEEHRFVQINLLAEVEEVANIAGSIVHSFICSTYEDPEFYTIDQRYGAILERMALLKGSILKFSSYLPVLITQSSFIVNPIKNSSLFIVDSLIFDLENLLNRDDSLIGDVKDQIKILHHELMLSRSLFKSVMVPQPHYSKIPDDVTIRITEVAYEAEYLINSFLAGDTPLWYLSMRLLHVVHKIKLIGNGLQEIKNNYDIGALRIAKNNLSNSQLPTLQANTRNSEAGENIVVGLEDGVAYILDKLVGGTEQLQIIFIFGMPGLGKTTLANKLYNHPSVTYKFDRRSWCVVSQMYQRKSLLIDIHISSSIDQFDKDKISNMEEESLAEKIYKSLKGRRYLIVIDDVWDIKAWDDLRSCFPDDGNGSRILLTSRNKDVAPPNSIMYSLPYLSNDQCWELLEKKVFKDKQCPSQFLGVGKEIAANCHGLPLAVVVIAGILSTTDKESSAWKKVGEKAFSYSHSENDSMMQILELSYKHLPQHLKPCFLYFGVFPEDQEISTTKLMRLWVAEGFIPKDTESLKNSECLAEKYLMELIDKSLVMVVGRRSGGGVKTCVIHDRLRDLCLKISKEENFIKLLDDDKYSIYEKSHCLVQSRHPCLQGSFGLHVRSFHAHSSMNSADAGKKLVEPAFFCANMKLVRVLDSPSLNCFVGVEYLVNLRYLVIPGKLPLSIGSLVNLEYLCIIRGYEIPFPILKMDKLKYLHFTGSGAYFDYDCNLSQTNNLQVLSGVCINFLNDEDMLKCSPNLRKLKCICAPLYVRREDKVRYLDLLFFTHLESLTMCRMAEYWIQVVKINFPLSIRKLDLDDLQLPLVNMSIIGSLPNLQVLKLLGEVFKGETWVTRDEEFQQLTFLKLAATNFKQWTVASWEHFPKLQRLVLHSCYNLEEFPCEIGEILTLQLIEVVYGKKAVAESVRNIEQEQLDMGNEKLQVIIRE